MPKENINQFLAKAHKLRRRLIEEFEFEDIENLSDEKITPEVVRGWQEQIFLQEGNYVQLADMLREDIKTLDTEPELQEIFDKFIQIAVTAVGDPLIYDIFDVIIRNIYERIKKKQYGA